MKNIIETINVLPEMTHISPATNEQIKDAEQQLNLRFSDEYKEYLSSFGAVLADGIEISGLAKSKHWNVISLTQQERKLNNNVGKNMYVIENAAIDGIIIWQDENGLIYLTQYDSKPKQIATSLVDYITNYLKK